MTMWEFILDHLPDKAVLVGTAAAFFIPYGMTKLLAWIRS